MYKKRLEKLQSTLKTENIDAIFVSNPYNVYYLSGFRPLIYNVVQPVNDPEGFLLVTKNDCFLLTDPRYEGAAKENKNTSYISLDSGSIAKITQQYMTKDDTVGFEEDSLLYKDLQKIKTDLEDIKTTDASNIVLEQRVIKDESEIKLLEEASKITSAGFDYALSKIRQGMTEKELAFEITSFFLKEAEGNSFSPIIAFKKGSAIPHYETSDQVKIEGSGILLIDLGCIYKGYCGDMTRTIHIGKADKKFKKNYAITLEAQENVLQNLTTGITGKQADELTREVLRKYNYEDYFIHGTGHGLGLAIHENPRLSKRFDHELKNGMVFSVEPGVYISDWGGIRIEDIVYLKNGKAVNITDTTKDIIEI